MGARQRALCAAFVVNVALHLAGCAIGAQPAPNNSQTFVVFGDSGYHYDYMPYWYSDVTFPSEAAFDAGFQPYWEKVKGGPIPNYEIPPAFYHQDLGGYVHASGLQPVAEAMRKNCSRDDCAFAIMLGDNIYPDGATLGADGRNDSERFDAMLSRPFSPISDENDNFLIYSVLGNHDWATSRDGALAQIRYLERHRRFYMDDIYYRVIPPGADGDVELFVIDTDIMLAGETIYKNDIGPDGRPIRRSEVSKAPDWLQPRADEERKMLRWLEAALRDSTAKWKFVIGHHPLWSSGGRKDHETIVARRLLLPILCKYADAYFAGHEHSLEVHTDSCTTVPTETSLRPLLHVVSGAASRMSAMNRAYMAFQESNFPQYQALFVRGMVWGYTTVTISGSIATLKMFEVPPEADAGDSIAVFEHEFRPRHATRDDR